MAIGTTTSTDESELIELALRTGVLDPSRADAVRAATQASGGSAITALIEHGQVEPRLARALRGRQRQDRIPAIIDGWRLGRTIGVGGMAVVFHARRADGAEAALKVLSPAMAGDPTAAERFLREARVMASVSHPNLLAVHGSGAIDGRCWLAMDYMPGGDAAARMAAAGGVLAPGEALRLIRDAARGAQALHAAGLIHRDIKPANIFLAADGSARLADLGLAKGDSPDDQLTRPGMRVGTPVYMAPEQVRCDVLDARCDVYALGATLYHLITGRRPYTGTVPEMLRAVLAAKTAPDPRVIRPELDRRLADLVRDALQPDRERRPRDAGVWLRDLEAILAGRRPASRSLLGRLRRLIARRWPSRVRRAVA